MNPLTLSFFVIGVVSTALLIACGVGRLIDFVESVENLKEAHKSHKAYSADRLSEIRDSIERLKDEVRNNHKESRDAYVMLPKLEKAVGLKRIEHSFFGAGMYSEYEKDPALLVKPSKKKSK